MSQPVTDCGVSLDVSLIQGVETFLRLGLTGRAVQTAHWYRDRLVLFANWMGAGYPLVGVQEIDLLEFCAYLGERPLSPATCAGYVRAIKRLFKWLNKKGLLPANPAADLELPRLPKIGKRGISETDFIKLLGVSTAPRDTAILHFLWASGCRCGGAASLKLDDLDLPRLRALVREKGSVERVVFLTEEAGAALGAWLAVRPECNSRNVFVGRTNGEIGHHALAGSGIYWVVKRLAVKAEVKASPHQFRHAYGRRLAEGGMNLGVLSQLMGHSSVNITVAHYGQFATDELERAYRRTCEAMLHTQKT